jgi:hypothetical protein
MNIEKKEINYAQYSLIDNIGRVFEYNNKIYRGINKESLEHVKQLFSSGLITELIEKELFPNTIITDFKIDGFSLVLEHEKLFFSCSFEWTFDMLLDAALLTLEVNKIAFKYGFQLKDAHTYNVLFKNNKACFIDLGSFQPKSDVDFLPLNEFLECFCLPLVLYSKGKSYIAHKFQLDIHYPQSRLLIEQLPFNFKKHVIRFQVLNISFFKANINISLNRFIFIPSKIVRKIIQKINSENISCRLQLKSNIDIILKQLKIKNQSTWANYQDENFENNLINSTERFDSIIQLTKSLTDIESALDVAANKGLLPVLLLKNLGLKNIIHLDYDVNACNAAYLYYKTHKLPINIVCTSFLELALNESLRKRLKVDIVFGLALTHHLVLSQNLPLDLIFSIFSDLSNRYVAIEFMPLGLWDGFSAPPIPVWYNLDWFRAIFKNYFEILIEKQIETNRIIFIGKKFN